MPTDFYFKLQAKFNPAPGQPKDLKCIGCSVAIAGASLTTSTLLFYKAKKTIAANLMVGMAYGITGMCFGILGATFGRRVYDDTLYNDRLVRLRAEELSNARKQTHIGAKDYESTSRTDKKIVYV